MKWYSVEIDDDFGVREFIQYLHQNEVKFETSDLDNGGKHFEIYCDEFTANRVDNALDLVFDHMAEKENGRLTDDDYKLDEGIIFDRETSDEDKERIKREIQENATYKRAKRIAQKYGYTTDPESCYVLVYYEQGKWKRWINFVVTGNNKYDPNVYYQAPVNDPNNYRFGIYPQSQAAALQLDEYEKFVERVTAAYEMVKRLSNLDFNTLYEVTHKDED